MVKTVVTSDRVVWAFVLVVVVAIAVTTLSNHNHINGLQKANRDSCQNFTILKTAVNDFHRSIDKFLTTARKARLVEAKETKNEKVKKTDLKAAAIYGFLLQNTHLVSATCAQNK